MLAIQDAVSGRIKWSHTGPWVRQHDPDITADGKIEVFNNGDDRLSIDRPPGSNIISLDPATGEIVALFPLAGQPAFFADIMGTHQRLANGNRLITESRRGRVFEVDPAGDVVWEYVERYDDEHAAWLAGALRYDEAYLTVADWDCPQEERAQ